MKGVPKNREYPLEKKTETKALTTIKSRELTIRQNKGGGTVQAATFTRNEGAPDTKATLPKHPQLK